MNNKTDIENITEIQEQEQEPTTIDIENLELSTTIDSNELDIDSRIENSDYQDEILALHEYGYIQ